MSEFSVDTVRHIAKLSSLELTPEEEILFAQQFTTIFNYFEQISQIQLPESSETPLEPPPFTRVDEAHPSPVDPEQFSPYLENGFFKVPRVLET